MSLRPYQLVVGVLLSAVWWLGGCAGSPSASGVRIGDETLKQIEAGVTTERWLVAILGEPTSLAVVEGVENTTVYRYALTESAGGLASLFTGNARRNTAVVYFVITEGVVTRYWADRRVERSVLGNPFEAGGGEKRDTP